MVKTATKALLAFCILIFSSIWIIQNYTHIPRTITRSIITLLEKEWKATIAIKSASVNFFTFSIHFNEGTITPTDQKKYAWSFKSATAYISPIKLLLSDPYSLYLTFNETVAQTQYENQQADLALHIKDMFSPRLASLNVFPRSIIINNFNLTLYENKHTWKLNLIGRIRSNYDDNKRALYLKKHWHGSFALSDGSVKRNDTLFIEDVSSLISFYYNHEEDMLCFSHATDFKSKHLSPDNLYTIEGEYNATSKQLRLTDSDNTTDLLVKQVAPRRITLAGHAPLNNTNIEGTCSLDTQLQLEADTISCIGRIDFSDINVAGSALQDITINLTNKRHKKIDLDNENTIACTGTLAWSISEAAGLLTLSNATAISTPFTYNKPVAATYTIDPNKLRLNTSFTSKGTLKGTYSCCITKQSSEKEYNHKGDFIFNNQALSVTGRGNDGNYSLRGKYTTHPFITRCLYIQDNNTLVNLEADTNNKTRLHGTIQWKFIESLLPTNLTHLLSGNNETLNVSLNQDNPDHIVAQLKLDNGHFYIPGRYNLLNHFAATISYKASKKLATISDTTIQLSKGKISCPYASCTFDEEYNLKTAELPLTANKLFINWERDFYAVVEGNLLLTKKRDLLPSLTGSVLLKKSLIKDRLLKQTNLDNHTDITGTPLAPFPLCLDIELKTEKPIKARGDDFDALAHAQLRVMCTPQESFGQVPHLIGTITVEKGSLKLLNKKLDITQGSIQFLENKINDPLIDIVAKNRIHKYHIHLQASGSLTRPTILLESSPELSEEQIIGLLCSGSENTPLKSTISCMLLDQIKELLTKNNKKKPNELLDTLGKSLQYVQITPNINQTSGKVDGLRGSISVNVNDQIRAQIQKDFSLDDKFSAQLEYLFSDDINFKVVKDHHGELGSELEVRLKL